MQVDELNRKKKDAEAKLSELTHVSDDAWENLKSGVDSTWKSPGNAINSASSRFQ